jgi:hypothetical protein
MKRADLITVLAIAALVYTGAKVVHEGLGHGGICLAVGGTLRGVSSSWADCDTEAVGPWGRRAVHAAGTIANLLAAAVFLFLSRRPTRTGQTAYFFWLGFCVNALMAGGYLMVDPLFGFGDWTAFLVGLAPLWPLRLTLTAIGLVVTMLAFRRAGRTLIPLVGTEPHTAVPSARLLCWAPWAAAGGVLLTGAAALNVYGPKFAFTSALATLGGTWMLVWVPSTFGRPRPTPQAATLTIDRSTGYIAAGFVALAFLLSFFGPGITSG